jgi:hypothetical protein
MNILKVACIVLLPAALSAQRVAQAPELPDSSYLALTLDLPIHGTFQVSAFQQLRSGSRATGTVLFEIRNVEVQGCMLSLLKSTGTHQDFRPTTRSRWEVRIPLKAIDLKSIQSRMAQGGARLRYEPALYEVVGFARDRRARPITFRDVESGRTYRDWNFSIPVRDSDVAARFSAILIDAAQRCDVWRTAPMSVIR